MRKIILFSHIWKIDLSPNSEYVITVISYFITYFNINIIKVFLLMRITPHKTINVKK